MNVASPCEPQAWVRPERAVDGDGVTLEVEAPAAVGSAPAIEDASLTEDEPALAPVGGGGWTIPLICIGMAVIACCVLVPAADENRRVAYEGQRLQADLAQIKDQIQMNDQFLRRVSEDPSLSERLAQRQLKIIREGTGVLTLKGQSTSR